MMGQALQPLLSFNDATQAFGDARLKPILAMHYEHSEETSSSPARG